jgi:hypothetical protein
MTADELKNKEAEVIDHWLLQAADVCAQQAKLFKFRQRIGFGGAILSDG